MTLGATLERVSVLSEEEIERRLALAPKWGVGAEGSIVRDYELADFPAAIALVNRVGELAEEANHHPDILLHGWNHVRLTLSTHSQGGVTDADFRLAGKIDSLA